MAIQFLRGTKSTLASSNQIFLAGQPVFESDSGQLKIGDGVNSFSTLPYVGEGLSSGGGGSITAGTYHSVDSRTAYIDVTENYRIVIRRSLTTIEQDDLNTIKQHGRLTLTYPDGSQTEVFYRDLAYNRYTSIPISESTTISQYLYDKVPFASLQAGVWRGRYDFSDTASQLVSHLIDGNDFRYMLLDYRMEFDNEDPDVITHIHFDEAFCFGDDVTFPAYFTTTTVVHTFKS